MTAVAAERAAARGVDVTLQKQRVTAVSQASVPGADLLEIAASARAHEPYCLYWERPADGSGMVALGATQIFTAAGTERFHDLAVAVAGVVRRVACDAVAERLTAPRFVGGFAFAPDATGTGGWRGFPSGLIVLPRLLIERRAEQAWLTATSLTDDAGAFDALRAAAAAELQQLIASTAHAVPACVPTVRYAAAADTSPPMWEDLVAEALAEIEAGRLDKLVLARSCTVSASRSFDAARILRRLRRAYPSCIAFWMGTPGGDFLGATPETLVRVEGRTVSTAAIAGTTAAGTCEASARALGNALRQSGKERAEHALVVEALAEALAPLCRELTIAPEPTLLRLENVQHLLTPIAGMLRRRHHVLELVARLHPSPAVAGSPRRRALQLLREREGLDRGWYAGPIGWMDAGGDGEFAVAIRSAVLHGAQASVYAGAGIVAGSDPEGELLETRLKMQPLLSALLEL